MVSDGQDDDPLDVLVRSKQVPELPFSGSLTYQGIQVKTTVSGLHTKHSIVSVEGYSVPQDEFYSTVNLCHQTPSKKEIYQKEVAETEDELISLWTKVAGEEDHNYILYRVDYSSGYNGTYVVSLGFHFVYNITPSDTSLQFICRETTEYRNIPDSTPKSQIEGTFCEPSTITTYSRNDDCIQFESSSIVSSLLGNGLEIEVELIDCDSVYDMYELKRNQFVGGSDVSEEGHYCSADIKILDNDCVVKCDHPEGPVTFRFGLTRFGTLPNWIEERINIDTIVTHLETDQSIMAEIEEAGQSTDDKWTSELGDYELTALK